MISMNNQKQNNRSINGGRRLLAWLCALMMLVSSSGVTAFAESGSDIYSDPVTVPTKDAEKADEPAEEDPQAAEPSEEGEERPEESPEENPEEVPSETESEDASEQAPAIEYAAGSLTAEAEGCTILVEYTAEACIPEGAILTVTPAEGMNLYAALKSAAKALRQEENETWKQKIADEGNLFYVLTVTDAEGNAVQPGAGMTLTYQNPENPEGVTYFLTGEEPKILEAEDGAISIPDYNMAPFGYATIEQEQVGIITQEFNGRDYQVTVTYGPEAGFPADTELKVREIMPGTDEYALYSGMTDEALNEEWSEITLERYFDIAFVSGGEEIEPRAEIDVQIIFRDVIELTEEHDVQAVHIENNEANVIEAVTDSNENAVNNSEAIDTVSFSSDSFSVYGVVQRKKITQKVLAADGLTYQIEVTYGPEAEIPEDAQLKVVEIPEGSDLWEAYRKQTAAALDADDVRLPGLFDITIVDAEGNEIEPKAPISVSITLVNAEEGNEELHIVHFTEDLPETLINPASEEQTEEQAEVQPLAKEDMIESEKIEADVDGKTVTFETNGFSIYAFAYAVITYVKTAFGETYEITLNYDADAGIPRDAQLKVEEIPEGSDLWEAYRKQTAAALGADDVRLPGLYDITIIDAEGNEIEPQAPVSVSITLANAEEGNTELHVVHFTEEIPQELVTAAAEEKANLEDPENEQAETQPLPEEDRIESEKIESSVEGQTVTFETKGFSIYAFAYAIVTYYRTASGETYEITLSFGREARIPEDAELAVREILPGDEAYEEYYAQATKAAMEAAENNGSELPMATGARLFDIEIHGENGKIEPAAPVQVTIRLVGDTESDMLSVVHFAETGTEVVALQENPEGEADGISEIRFEAESFSVYTVVSVDQLVSQGKYILVSGIAGDPGANIGYSESWGTDYFTRVVNGMAITDEPNSAEHGLDAVGVHWWEDGGQFYVGGEATEWTLEYNDNTQAYLFEIEKGGTTYYFRWLGYDRGDGQMEWDGMELTTDRGLATAFGFEPTGDNDGTYWIYLAQDGFYKQRYLQNYQYAGTNEWSSRCYRLTSVSDRSVLQDKAFKFRIGQKSEDFDPVAARKISVQSLTTNSSYIIYRKLEDEKGNEELYALASDGTFVRVYDGGDLLYYRETGKNIFWTYNESNGVYLESLNNGERVFINPRASSGQTIISNETEDIKSLTLPGKNNGLYGSTIECWDQPAYDYAGLHVTTVKDNDGNTTAVNLTAGKQKAGQSDEFLFAVASSMPRTDEATPVATVNSASLGIQITMYDYGDPEHDYGFGNKLDEMTSAVGSDAYTPHAAHALVKHYLDPNSGLPLPNGSDTPMSGVFGNSTGGAITSIITGVNHLFLQSYYNESGTFRYRSEDNYAYIPRDGSNPNFTVYQQIATPYTTDRAVGHAYFYHGHFMPFNDIDMSNHISHLLDQYGTSPLSLEDGRAYEDVYGVVGTPNYFTGLKMEANFVQPSDGTLEDGSPMVFKFTGDDDMWVYIDGVLVLDIGGIHEPLSGTINFATGKVTNPSGSGVRETTLYNIFMAVKNDPNTPQDVKDTINQIQWDGDTFADFTTHSFKAFYMERGAGASNLDLQFNLKVTKMDEFTVRKQLPEGVDARFSNQLFKYQATYRHGNEVLPLHAGISGVCNNITYKDIRDENGQPISVNVPVDENGYFYLRAGEAAVFHMAEQNIEYNVKEVEIDTTEISRVDINQNENVTITQDTGTPANGQIAEAGFERTHKRGEVVYTNYPVTQDLLITKHLTEDSAPLEAGELPVFEYHVYIETTELGEHGTTQYDENGNPLTNVTKLVPYSYGPYYLVKDGAYYTLTGENNAPVRQGTVPVLCSTTGRSGTINSIPPEYTVLIPDIAAGTHFYVEERIDQTGLKGYEFDRIELKTGTYEEQTLCDPDDYTETDVIDRAAASDENEEERLEFDPAKIGKIKSGTDAQVDVYNRKPAINIPVEKKWDASSPKLPTITMALIRFGSQPQGQQIVIGDEKGGIIIHHYANFGSENETLPEGFRATYTITNSAGEAVYEGVPAGNYAVDPGNYTVTATVLDSGTVSGSYTYNAAASTLTASGVVVIQNQSSTATLVSRYSEVEDGSITISHQAAYTNGSLTGNALPAGFEATYTIRNSSGQNVYTGVAAGTYSVAPGSYTVIASVSNNAQPTDYYYQGTPDQTASVSSSANTPVTLTSTYLYQEAPETDGYLHIVRQFEGLSPNNFQAKYRVYDSNNQQVTNDVADDATVNLRPGNYRIEAVVYYNGDNTDQYNLVTDPVYVTITSNETTEATVTHTFERITVNAATVTLAVGYSPYNNVAVKNTITNVASGSKFRLVYSSDNPGAHAWTVHYRTTYNWTQCGGGSVPGNEGAEITIGSDSDNYIILINGDPASYEPNATITLISGGTSELKHLPKDQTAPLTAVLTGEKAVPVRMTASSGMISAGVRMRASGDVPAAGGTPSGSSATERDLVPTDLLNLIIPDADSLDLPEGYSMDTGFGKILTLSDPWNYTFEGLAENDANGNEYYYVLVEVVPVNYVATYDPQVRKASDIRANMNAINAAQEAGETPPARLSLSVENTKVTGDLAVEKRVEGRYDTVNTFWFEVTLTPPEGKTLSDSYDAIITDNAGTQTNTSVSVTDSKITFSLMATEQIRILDLPDGTGYSVAEIDNETHPLPEGYTEGTHINDSGSIVRNNTATATMKNNYSTSIDAQITGIKEVTEAFGTDPLAGFSFTLIGDSGEPMPEAGGDTAVSDNEGEFEFGTITYNMTDVTTDNSPDGNGIYTRTFTYSVKETVPAPEVTNEETEAGFAIRNNIKYDLSEPEVTVTVTYNMMNGTMTQAVSPEQAALKFSNEQMRGTLIVTKTIKASDTIPSGTYTYPVKISTVINETSYYIQDTEGTLGTEETTLTVTAGPQNSAGDELTVIKLPLGTFTYTVTEVSPENVEVDGFRFILSDSNNEQTFAASVTEGSAQITDYATPGRINLVNCYINDTSWSHDVYKELNGIAYTEGAEGYDGYTFALTEEDTQNTIQSGGEYTHRVTAVTDETGKASFGPIEYRVEDLDGADSRDFYYTITEVRPEGAANEPYVDDGIQYDPKIIYAVVTVSKVASQEGSPRKLQVTEAFYSDAEHTAELTETVFDNTEVGTLTVTKQVTGDYDAEGETFQFTVMKGEEYVEASRVGQTDTYAYSGLSEEAVTYDIAKDETITFNNLPAGTYVVTEEAISKDGYITSTTYQVGGEPADTAEAAAVRNGTAEVTIINDYQAVTEVSVTKEWLLGGTKVNEYLPNASVTVQLQRSTDRENWATVAITEGEVSEDSFILNSGNNWTKSWSGLPVYDKQEDNGTVVSTAYEYRVVETAATIDGTTELLAEGTEIPAVEKDGKLVLTNDLPDTSLNVTKYWVKSDGETPHEVTQDDSPIRFQLFYRVEGAEEDTQYTVDADANGNYSITYNSEGEKWNTVFFPNLPLYILEDDALLKVTGYTVEEKNIGTTVTYSNNGPVIDETITITNTDNKGKVQVKKTFVDLPGEIPGDFVIKAGWEGLPETITLTTSGDQPTGEGFTVSLDHEEGNGNPFIWTIDGLPVDTDVTFTEEGGAIDGYYCIATVKVNTGDTVKGTAGTVRVSDIDDNIVEFVNTYSAGTELPATGGSGTLIYTAGGLALVLIAGALLISRRKRKEM